MKKLLTAAACALLAMPALSVADDDGHGPPPHAPPAWHGGPGHFDRDDHRGPFPYHVAPRPYGYYGPRVYGYGPPPPRPYGYGPPPPYYGHGHHHGHDNDDPVWALGGFILGAIVGNVAAQDHPPKPAQQSAPVCYDSVAYDSSGAPYVKRDCR